MLTLKELKKIVKVADMEKRIPSVKSLKEHKVVVKEMINADTTISVYDHGYVLYTAGNQSTVFPLHSCDDYEYVSVTGDNKEFNKEFFDNENWYIRLLMVWNIVRAKSNPIMLYFLTAMLQMMRRL